MDTPENARLAIVRLQEAGHTYEEIADAVVVGTATVSRTLRRWREGRSLKPQPHRGGNPSPLNGIEKEFRVLVAEHADATAEELADLVAERWKIDTSRSAIVRFLKRLGFTRKKRSS
jgi:transposase